MSNKLNEKNNNINNIKILSVKDFSYKPDYPNLSYKIPQDILYNNYKENEDKNNNANLSLIHSIENSLINKDYDTFLWCLQQENKEIIIESVKKMNRDTIEMFFEKVIDLFQSNNFYKKNVVIWIIEIFKYHKFEILSMENKIIKNLNIIKNYITNYTKNYNNLLRIQEKLNIINKYKKNNNNIQENNNINDGNNLIKNNNNPLLTYMESDDEEEIEKNKIKKLKENGFEEVDSDNESNNNENEMDIDEENKIDNEEENDFDIDEDSNEESIQSEENIFKNKKKKNITNEEEDEEEEEDENN